MVDGVLVPSDRAAQESSRATLLSGSAEVSLGSTSVPALVKPRLPDVPAVSAEMFRVIMSRWCSGVTVVTTRHEERVHGMVASSFTGVSIDPVTILFCADQKTRTCGLIKEAGHFAVNVLGTDQQETFSVFAGQRGDPTDRFAGEDIRLAITGAPILAKSLAWMDCRVVAEYPGGNTHSIFIGEVLAAGIRDEAEPLPLVYFSRKLRHLAQA